MKIVKILIAGIAVTVFNAAFGWATCGWLFNWVYEIEPTNVWKLKSMESVPFVEFNVGVLVLSIILAIVYVLFRKGIPGQNSVVKGLVFGLCVWAVGMLPGMFMTHTFMTVAQTVVIYWTISGLVNSLLSGLIIAAICGK